MISKILVTTDGSKQARKSIEYAARFAKQTGATVTLLSVIDKSSLCRCRYRLPHPQS